MTAPERMRCGRVKDAAPYGWGAKKAAVHHPRWGGDGGLTADAVGVAPSADGALDDWGFRAVRGATKGSAFGNRDLGCPPFVGKSGRRGILRQAKVWRKRPGEHRRHTDGG